MPPETGRPLCIIKAGNTYPRLARTQGDFQDWVAAGLGRHGTGAKVVDPRRAGPLPDPADCAGVVMTGSHTMVTDWAPWMARLADWLAEVLAADVPFLGICFGHQLLARALGGQVDYHPDGREVGTVSITLEPAARDDPLFARLPDRFQAHVVHAQSVRTLPPGAVRLAGNGFEPTQAFRAGSQAWGVQFHPEFDGIRMAAYVDALAGELTRAGRDPRSLRAGIHETPMAASLLPAFSALCRNRMDG